MQRKIVDRWEAVTAGELTGPDGRTYRRRTTRASRRTGEEVVWTGGAWTDGDERTVVVLTGHC